MQALYFGADEKAPQIGDTKISFEKIVLPEVSIVGMQDGDSLTNYTTQKKTDILCSFWLRGAKAKRHAILTDQLMKLSCL